MKSALRSSLVGLVLLAGTAHADLGLSLGVSDKYGTSTAVGIYGESWGLELGAMEGDDTVQYPGGSQVREGPWGLDAVYLSGDRTVQPYVGLGLYMWRETILTPGEGAIVYETRNDHLSLAGGFGLRVRGRRFSYGAGYHTIRGPNLSFIYHWR